MLHSVWIQPHVYAWMDPGFSRHYNFSPMSCTPNMRKFSIVQEYINFPCNKYNCHDIDRNLSNLPCDQQIFFSSKFATHYTSNFQQIYMILKFCHDVCIGVTLYIQLLDMLKKLFLWEYFL